MVGAVDARADERVLDVATGTGLVAQTLVRRYGCEVVGLDQSPEMLAGARERLAGNPTLAERISLVQGEAERLPFADEEFDHLTFTYLLRYVEDPSATMTELARVVKPGGRIASLEFAVPGHAGWRWLWRLYTRRGLPTFGRLVSREWGAHGPIPRREHPELLRAPPDLTGGGVVGAGRNRGCASSPDEPGRGRCDVGHEGGPRVATGRFTVAASRARCRKRKGGRRWRRQARLSAPHSMRCGPVGGAIC
jgi:SAM-dependent methyltransferase